MLDREKTLSSFIQGLFNFAELKAKEKARNSFPRSPEMPPQLGPSEQPGPSCLQPAMLEQPNRLWVQFPLGSQACGAKGSGPVSKKGGWLLFFNSRGTYNPIAASNMEKNGQEGNSPPHRPLWDSNISEQQAGGKLKARRLTQSTGVFWNIFFLSFNIFIGL